MSWGEKLSTDHRRMLVSESAISGRVLVRRGYRTVTRKAELERLGFSRSQRGVPALLCPVYSPSGGISLYLSRPDEPRISNGRVVKYEIPSGSSMALDVHPMVNGALADPGRPLFITEGVKKGDALTTHGLAAIALVGVWNFRGRNAAGGKTVLPEWEYVALNGRTVYIAFDSDVMEKPEVYGALVRLKSLLEHRKAKVRFIYLPAAEGGAKQGVDDYLAAGHTKEDLLSRATSELRPPPHEDTAPRIPYRATRSGLVWDRPVQDGVIPTPLTNFTAWIAADVTEDDGAEERRSFEIEAELAGRRQTFTIPSSQFTGMAWATEYLGARAIVYPGFGLKDHARTAIQELSGESLVARHVYAHTGWREVEGEWVYLHAGGAVGRFGQLHNIHVDLTGPLIGRTLPEPGEADPDEGLAADVRASLNLRELAPESITATLLSATYRAALGESDFSAHLSGPTGEGKSELAALYQQHYGAALDSRHLASWESTENAIEGQAFAAKDQVMVLDDFAPTGGSHDVDRWHKKADRVLRAKGNASARQRMRADTTLRPDKPPRALMVSTGEDVPRGQSLRARMMILELSPGDFDFERLSRCQKEAADGTYTRAMAGFLRWLAPRYREIRASFGEEHAELRDAASTSEMHRRTPGIVADLALGLRYVLTFAHDAGALSADQARQGWVSGWQALGEAAALQGRHQAAGEPTRRFREFLSAAIASGQAHVASPEGSRPEMPGAWGWRESADEYKPQGKRIGWLKGKDLYLEPEASYAAAQKQGRDSGEPLTATVHTLRKRLFERGLLASTDEGRGTLTVRRTLEGSRRCVLHTSHDFLSQHVAQPAHADTKAYTCGDSIPPLWASPVSEPAQQTAHGQPGVAHDTEPAQQTVQQNTDTYAENPADG